MDLDTLTKKNVKHILNNFYSINKWCKNLSPLHWGVLYALKTHTKGINQFLYNIHPNWNKINTEITRLKQQHTNWTDDDIKIEIATSGNFNAVFTDYMTTILLCKAANKINKNEQFLKVIWNDEQLKTFAWNISSMVNCKSLENQMWVKDEYNKLLCLYVIRECLNVFMALPRNTIDITVKHGGSKMPKKIPETILHKSFLSTDYYPAKESMWTINGKHVIYIPGESMIPLLYIEACINGEENEIMLPPGIVLNYTEKNSKYVYATASLLQKYWIGMNGLTEIKPKEPYIMVNWNKREIKDTLPNYKLPSTFEEFASCVSHVFPIECDIQKTNVTGGNKIKNLLKLVYHAI
jgi:hypothetical protein